MFIETSLCTRNATPAGVVPFLSTKYCYKHSNPLDLHIEIRIFIIQKPTIMADTFTQIYIQVVFAVQNRNALIHKSWEEELYKYITGIIQNKGQKMLAINGTSNHIHFFYWNETQMLPF